MIDRHLPAAVGVASGLSGVALLIAVLGFARGPDVPPAPAPAASPRPIFALDTPEITGSGRATVDAGADPLVRSKENVRALQADAAMFFGVPAATLDALIGRAIAPAAASSGLAFSPPQGRMLEEVFRAHDALSEKAAERLFEFLDEDPRPFGATTLVRPEVAIGLRAAYLAIQEGRLAERLEEAGFHASEGTMWFLVTVGGVRDHAELDACIEAARALPEGERAGCLVAEPPTFEIFANPRFVLKAFLAKWPPDEAKARRQAFVAEVLHVGVKRGLIPGPASDVEPDRAAAHRKEH